MRIAIHDFPGHAFPIELSRALAGRGHDVLHLHFTAFQSPKGPLDTRADDPGSLTIDGLDLGAPFAKQSLPRRYAQERTYAQLAAAKATAFKPDWVLSNGPLGPQAALRQAAHASGGRYALWLQDLYGIAIDGILRRRFPVVGHLAGAWFRWQERRLLRGSDAVVCITPDFLPIMASFGVDPARCPVIPNWAPLADIPALPRDNAFAREHGLLDAPVFLYSGTMGFKHDPALLTALARAQPDATVVVASEGQGADWLAAEKASGGLDNLMLLPFQPHERFAEMLAAADVLVAMIEPDAGRYSVPSKVLSYLCAGRAILLSAPLKNLAARTVTKAGAGAVVEPGNPEAFTEAAARLAADPPGYGAAGRRHAETTFDIAAIAARFETVFAGSTDQGPAR